MAFFNKRKLFARGLFRYRWIEESMSLSAPVKNQRPVSGSGEFLGTPIEPVHLKWVSGALLVLLLVVIGRIGYLELGRGKELLSMAEQNRIRLRAIPAKRGILYDRAGIPIVSNGTSFSLALVPHDLPRNQSEREQVLQRAATLAGLDVQKIYDTLEEYKKYAYESITVKEGIPYETALAFIVTSADLPGVRIVSASDRNYSYLTEGITTSTPSSLAHMVGYMGKLTKDELAEKYQLGYSPSDRIGKIGIEKTFEDFLRGSYGKQKVEVDATGKERLVLAEEAPVPGRHVVLGLDMKLQKKLEDLLADTLKKNNKKRAAAVVIDPHTGTIRAIVSLPAYDNNDFARGITTTEYEKLITDPDQPLFNRAISGMYPSGSTIKPLIASAALQEGIITAGTSFLSSGGIEVGLWFFPDWKAGGHGITNVVKALAESVNTFFYIVGGGYKEHTGLGVEKINTYLKQFGLGDALGIDMPGEAPGFLPTPAWKQETKKERWYIGDTYNMSIGQGDVLVTPLQMAVATAAIANGGTVYRPHLAERVIDSFDTEIQPIEPQILQKVSIKPEHLQTVQRGMRACVLIGSCRGMSGLAITSAGKTGTAEWSHGKENHAWYIGYAPFDNPEIVITILIEEGGEGSKIALPVARDFLQYWAGDYRLQNP